MSRSVKQPIGQKRLTNVAVVRYKKMGKSEKDIDEVLQTTTVFSNVSKGILAKHEDLQEVFKTTNELEICLKILAEGEVQVSDKERELEYDTLFKDVANIIADKCINPDTRRPYTITTLERALRDIHFSVDPKRSAKQQALEAIHSLQNTINIQRARMRLRIQVPLSSAKDMADVLKAHSATIETQDLSADEAQIADMSSDPSRGFQEGSSAQGTDNESHTGRGADALEEGYQKPQVVIVVLVEPGAYRDVLRQTQEAGEGSGRLEMLSLAATEALDAAPPAAPPSSESAASRERGEGQASPSQGIKAGETPGPARPRGDHLAGPSRPAAAPPHGAPKKSDVPPRPHRGDAGGVRRTEGALLELDSLEKGWSVELRGRDQAAVLEAVFFSPRDEEMASFADARRAALAARKAAAET